MIFASKHPRSFRGAARGLSTVLVGLGFAACGGDNNGGDAGSAATAHITDATNYKVVSSLTIKSLPVKAGADLRVCWDDLTTDLLKHPIVPTQAIDHVSFLSINNVSKADIALQFAAGTFDDTKVNPFRDFIIPDKTNTCASLSQFKLGTEMLNPATDFVPNPAKVYMLMWASGLTPGSGAKSMLFLDPDATSDVTQVMAPPGKDILAFQADLTTPQKVDIPAAGPYVIDWSGLTKDAMGQTVVYQKLDRIILGHYDMTIADLERQALDFEIIPTSLYQAAITPKGSKQIDLATTTYNGTPFSGFDTTTGFWGVAIMCSTCQIPAPVAVSVLNPG